MPNFDGKVAIVTGSSSGIGAATALYLAKNGARVVLHGRDPIKLQSTGSELISQGTPSENFTSVTGDIDHDSTQDALVKSAIEHFGHLDILVNNAGIMQKPGIHVANDVNNFDYLFGVNLRAPYRLAMQALPYLESRKGNIVNVSSIGAVAAFPDNVPYGATKAGLDSVTKALANVGGPKGVRVNGVHPGPTKTDFLLRFGYSETENTEVYDAFAQATLLGRSSTPLEQAKLIAFLASDDASFITGTVIANDGGFLAKASTSL
uniref:Short-chain dehydrogenase n=1 Tax=Panagrellus redivivus TaxID=6233 RepID=A0A7E4V7T6_PANRE